MIGRKASYLAFMMFGIMEEINNRTFSEEENVFYFIKIYTQRN